MAEKELRLYQNLNSRSKEQLLKLIDMVESHVDLSPREKEANLKNINDAIYKKDKILSDIAAGQTDFNDFK